MSRINQTPIGLQSLLRSKSLGQNPSDLSQVVVPTVDLSEMFAAERQFWKQEIRVLSATTVEAETGPEAGEIWLPFHISCAASYTGNPTGRDSLRATVRLLSPLNGPSSVSIAASSFVAASENNLVFTQARFDRNFTIWPGTRIAGRATQDDQTTDELQAVITVGYYALRV